MSDHYVNPYDDFGPEPDDAVQSWVKVLRLQDITLSAREMDEVADLLTDLETALLAARARIKELEAERDVRPVVRWVEKNDMLCLTWGGIEVGTVSAGSTTWYGYHASERDGGRWISIKDFPTPEAAKAAVEEALRGLSAKTEEA